MSGEVSIESKMDGSLKWLIGIAILSIVIVPIIGLGAYILGGPVLTVMAAALGTFNGMIAYNAYRMRKDLRNS